VTLLPWEYLWVGFSKVNFPDLFNQVWIGSLVLLILVVILYNVRTRALHRHRLYTDMWEWLLWSGLITFFLLIAGAVFQFDFAVILVIAVSGLGVMVWSRFRKYPPLFEAYEHQLARQRYLARAKGSKPEATIRSKSTRKRRRR
jgi:predicted membrane-bound dolichyl-phosphate-mannose-protein mannosyltransferase